MELLEFNVGGGFLVSCLTASVGGGLGNGMLGAGGPVLLVGLCLAVAVGL